MWPRSTARPRTPISAIAATAIVTSTKPRSRSFRVTAADFRCILSPPIPLIGGARSCGGLSTPSASVIVVRPLVWTHYPLPTLVAYGRARRAIRILNSDDLAPARHASRKTSQSDRHRRARRRLRGRDPGLRLLFASRAGRAGADAHLSARARGHPGTLRLPEQRRQGSVRKVDRGERHRTQARYHSAERADHRGFGRRDSLGSRGATGAHPRSRQENR